MRLLFAFSILMWSISLNAQILPQGYDTLVTSQSYEIKGNLDFGATSIHNAISSKFYRGGFIDDGMKDYAFDKHKGVNRIGVDGKMELSYTNFDSKIFKSKPWGYVIKAGAYAFGGMLYSKDTYGLAFYGNERYVGQTIDMSGSEISFTSFQKIGFGLIDPKSKSALAFNVYNISNRFTADFRDLQLIQAEDSLAIDIVMDGEVSARNNLKFNQGIGFGVDFDYYLGIDWQSNKTAFVHFSLNNIGVGYMYEKQLTYITDTTFHYSGLTFDQIIGENSIMNDSLNVLDTLGIRQEFSNPVFLLPGFIQIAKIVDEHQEASIQSFFGVRVYPTLIFAPYVFGGLDYKPLSWLRLGAMASYGGFTKMRAGFYANYNKGSIRAGLGTENLIGLFSKKGSGQSIYINLRCVF